MRYNNIVNEYNGLLFQDNATEERKGNKMAVTKKDIADYLGISRSAVSLVLNNTPGSTVSEKTRQRILKAAKDLGYREADVPPKLAYIIYNRDIDDPRYSMNLRAFEETAGLYQYSVVVMSVRDNPQDHQRLRNFVRSPDVAGLAVTGALDDTIIELVEGMGLPHVFYAVTERKDINLITIDNVKIACEATKYLISYGHTRIAFFTGSLGLLIHKQMLEGYRRALREEGIDFDKSLVQVSNEDDGYELCARAETLDLEFTAIYCVNTIIQFGALQRLKDRGVQVPGDISLLGTGYTDLAKASIPPLTSISNQLPPQDTAAAHLIGMIRKRAEGEEVGSEQIYLAEFEILPGGTVSMCSSNEIHKQRYIFVDT